MFRSGGLPWLKIVETRLHFVSDHAEIEGLGPWLEGYIERLRALQTSDVGIVYRPGDATHIVFLESGRRRLRLWCNNHIARHPLVKAFPGKCFIWSTEDNPLTWLPGLYVSMPAPWFDPSLHRAFRYFALNTEKLPLPPDRERDISYSFLGGPSSPSRAALYHMRHPESALVRETLNYNHGTWAPEEAIRSYVEILSRSRFTLCPAGSATSSYRIFEAMRAGSIPVIISDRLVLPAGPEWAACSVRVPMARVGELPRILGEVRDPLNMGQNAHEAFERYFGADRMLEHVARELNALGTPDYARARRQFRRQLWSEGAARVARKIGIRPSRV